MPKAIDNYSNPAAEERRLINRIDDFAMATKDAGHPWIRIDLKGSLARRPATVDPEELEKPDIKQLIDRNEGEITRQLKTTRLATQAEDDLAYLPDFPLLPVRRHNVHLTLARKKEACV